MKNLKKLLKEKNKVSAIIAYLQGNYRYFFYYKPALRWMIRKHIREQITWRISVMDRTCFYNGECKLCGCQTTALQMANKACKKPCYPEMMNKIEWTCFKMINHIHDV